MSTLCDNSSITAKRVAMSTCFAWCSEEASIRNWKSENYGLCYNACIMCYSSVVLEIQDMTNGRFLWTQ
jgi:hypothetical protein